MRYDNQWKKDKNISEKLQLEIISDASISSLHIANGKNIPLIIVNTLAHPEIERAIIAHTSVQNGHISTIWGKSTDDRFITLQFSLVDPVPKEFFVAFNVEKQGGLVDLIINSQLLYIQPGKPRDRLSNTMSSPRLMIEVPSTHFSSEWKLIFQRVMTKHFRQLGLNRKDAKNAALDFYKEWGIMRNFRMK